MGSWNAAYDNRIVFSLGYDIPANGADSIFIPSASSFTDTAGWHHVAVTVADMGGGVTSASLYVDGRLEGADTGSQNDRSIWGALRIGAPGDGSRSFNGRLDEVRIYQTALSPAQVQAIAEAGVLQNDTDPDLDVLNAVLVGGPANGTLALGKDGSFTYTPSPNFSGVDSFTYRANDGTTDSNLATVTLNVNPVNDAPAGADNAVTTGEDTAYPFTTADLGFTDPSDLPANALADVKITTLPAAGSLTLSSAPLTAGQLVSSADIASGKLKFTPPADANGTGYASFTFQVQDDGGTAAGGADLDPSANTITVNVTAANDPPERIAGSVSNLTVPEDSGLTSLGLGGVDYGPGGGADEAGQTLTYTVTVIPSPTLFGRIVLADGATPVTAGSTYTLAEIRGMQFETVPNVNGALSFFSYQVRDSGGTANGGADLLGESILMTVIPVNDAPVLGGGTLAAVAENTASPAGQAVATVFAGQFGDVDAGSSLGGIAVVGNAADAGTEGVWQYSSDGGANWFAVGAVADGATALAVGSASLVRFLPVADYNGSPPALVVRGLDDTYAGGFSTTAAGETRVTVDTAVNGGSTAIAAATATLSTTITSVNTPPVLAGIEGTAMAYAENQVATTVTGSVTVGDVDSANLSSATVQITGNYVSGEDLLSFTDTAAITGSWSAAAGTLTLSGSDTVTSYQAALRAVTYSNSSDNPSTLPRTVSFTGNDGTASSNTVSRAITVAGVNDAPVLGGGTLAAVAENTASPAGQAVATVFAGQFGDVDAGSSLGGIAVVGNAADAGTEGVWQYSSDGGANWFAVGAVADGATALAVGSASLVRFLPVADYNGSPPALVVRGLDDTYAGGFSTTAAGETRVTVDTAVNGGSTAIAAATATLSTTIDPVADTPSVTGAATSEDAQTTAGLVLSRSAVDGAEVTHFKITGISNGALYENDGTTPVGDGAFIPVAVGNAGLKFTPAANFSGSGGFTIQASTSNSDAGLGGSTVNATITVSPVADTPSVTDAATSEDAQTTAGLVLSRSAVDGAEVTHFKITGISNGTLYENDGTTPVGDGAFIPVAVGNAGLKFTPAANFSGSGGFTIQASTSNSDAGLGGSTVNATITVSPVADTPSVTGAATSEDAQTTSWSGPFAERGGWRRGDAFQDHGDLQRRSVRERRDDAGRRWCVHPRGGGQRGPEVHPGGELLRQRRLHDPGVDLEQRRRPRRQHGQRHDHGQPGGGYAVGDRCGDE